MKAIKPGDKVRLKYHLLPEPSSRRDNVLKWSCMGLVLIAAGFILYLIMTGQIDQLFLKFI